MPPDQHSELESAIYEAAIVPELWPAALARISDASATGGTAIVCINARGIHGVSSPNMDAVIRRFVDENWMARNSRFDRLVAAGLVGAPRFVTQEELFEPAEVMSDPLVTDLFRSAGFGRAAGFIVQLPHGDTVVVNVEQYWERGPILEEPLALLNSLYPHLARATMLAGRSDFRRVESAVGTLTALGLSAAAVAPNGRVMLANDGFAAAAHVWTTRGGDRLALIDRVADKLLVESLAMSHTTQAPRSIPVRDVPGGPVVAVVQVVPIKRSANDVFGGTSAIVVLSEPTQLGRQATLIQSLFDLTPAELAVAQRLASGETIATIARASGRSVHTVRTQLNSIMRKTGCSRQAELLLLMHQLAGRAS